jgi:hypothetical protein
VSRRQAGRWQEQEQQQYEQAPPPAPAPAPAADEKDMVTQLKELAELKDQGILTDAEFEAQKAKILAAG